MAAHTTTITKASINKATRPLSSRQSKTASNRMNPIVIAEFLKRTRIGRIGLFCFVNILNLTGTECESPDFTSDRILFALRFHPDRSNSNSRVLPATVVQQFWCQSVCFLPFSTQHISNHHHSPNARLCHTYTPLLSRAAPASERLRAPSYRACGTSQKMFLSSFRRTGSRRHSHPRDSSCR